VRAIERQPQRALSGAPVHYGALPARIDHAILCGSTPPSSSLTPRPVPAPPRQSRATMLAKGIGIGPQAR